MPVVVVKVEVSTHEPSFFISLDFFLYVFTINLPPQSLRGGSVKSIYYLEGRLRTGLALILTDNV